MRQKGKAKVLVPVLLILLAGIIWGLTRFLSPTTKAANPTPKQVKQEDPFTKVIKLQVEKGVNLICKGSNGWVFIGQNMWNPVRDQNGDVLIYSDGNIFSASSCFEITNMERKSVNDNGTYRRILRLETVRILPGKEPQRQTFLMSEGEIQPETP